MSFKRLTLAVALAATMVATIATPANAQGTETPELVFTDQGTVTSPLAPILGPSDPTQYRYNLDLPADQTVEVEGTKARVVDANGNTIGVLDAPSAVDANGANVPVYFGESEGTLVLTVDHNEGTAYPVVLGDPTYVTTTYWLSRADVERMWNALQTMNTLCGYIPLPYLASISCLPGAAMADAVASAHYQQKRIKAVYYNCGFNYCNYYKYYVVA